MAITAACSNNEPADNPAAGNPSNGGSTPTPSSIATVTKLDAFTTLPLEAIHFVNATTGYAVASKLNSGGSKSSSIYKTTDGANTWTKIYSTSLFNIAKIKSKDANFLMAIAPTGEILTTRDAGSTWSLNNALTGKNYHLTDLTFHTGDDEIYIVGYHETTKDGLMFIGINDGAIWSKNINAELTNLVKATPLMATEYLAATKLLVFSGGTSTKGALFTLYKAKYEREGNYTAAQLVDVAAKDGTVIAVGNNGLTNTGSEKGVMFGSVHNGDWNDVDYGHNNKLVAVALTPLSKNAVAVGRNTASQSTDGEFITVSKDNGNSWHSIKHSITNGAWNDVYALNADTFIAVGAQGMLAKIEIK